MRLRGIFASISFPDSLKRRLDNDEFAFRAAVEIAYLPDDVQELLNAALDSASHKLDMKKASQLREFAGTKPLNAGDMEEILAGLVGSRNISETPPKLTMKPAVLSRFFTPQHTAEDMEAEIVTALEFYRANNQGDTVDESE